MIYYRRPPFRVTAPSPLVFDVSSPRGIFCTTIVSGPDGALQLKSSGITRRHGALARNSFPSGQLVCRSRCTSGEEGASRHANLGVIIARPVDVHLPRTTLCRYKQMRLFTIRVRAFVKRMAML